MGLRRGPERPRLRRGPVTDDLCWISGSIRDVGKNLQVSPGGLSNFIDRPPGLLYNKVVPERIGTGGAGMDTMGLMVDRHSAAADGVGLPRIGGLLWWDFDDSPTPHSDLTAAALTCGFPAIFLPTPVSREVAFRRALQRAVVRVGDDVGGKWRADVTKKDGISQIGSVHRFEPRGDDDDRPWKVQFQVGLDRETGALYFAPSGGTFADVAIQGRVQAAFNHELAHATAEEIRESATGALVDVGGLRVRPGLWFVPTGSGAGRAEVVASWLRAAGHTRAGLVDLFDLPSHRREATDYATAGLQVEVARLLGDVQDVLKKDQAEAQTGALRTKWEALDEVEQRLAANASLLAAAADSIRAPIAEARRLLQHEAMKRDVALQRVVGKTAVAHLRQALADVQEAARLRDTMRLKDASASLVKGGAAALAGHFGPIYQRLRDLADVASEGGDSRFAALLVASTDVAARADRTYSGCGFDGLVVGGGVQ